MNPQRLAAIVLLVIAFLTLAASRALPFRDDVSGAAEAAIVIGGVVCALAGVYLWVRQAPDSKA
jgi:ABC-type Mn2+/Zn2+ transport system permease subunit